MIYSQKNNLLSDAYADSALIEIAKYETLYKDNAIFYDLSKAMALNNKGNVFFQQGKFNEAVKFCIKAVKIYEKHNSVKNIARMQNNLASILKAIGNYHEALYYYKKCAVIKEKFYIKENTRSTKFALATAYLNLGGAFGDLGIYDSSLIYLNKSLLLLDVNEKTDNLGLIYIAFSDVWRVKEDFLLAIYYSEKALDVYLGLGIPESTSMTYSGLAAIYYELKNYGKALHYVNLAEAINKENFFNDDLLNNYSTKANIYNKLNDQKNEVIFLKKHAALKDSLLKQNRNLQIEELKTQYETEKKEKEIVKLNKDNKIQELQLERETETRNRLITIIISIILVLLLLALLIFFLIRTVADRKKAYVRLQEKNIEIQNQIEKLSEQAKLISRYQSQMSSDFIFGALGSIKDNVVVDQTEKAIQKIQLFSKLMRETLNSSEKENITIENEINYLQTYLEFEQLRFNIKTNLILEVPADPEEILIPSMMIQPFIESIIKLVADKKIDKSEINLSLKVENETLTVKINYHIIMDPKDTAVRIIQDSFYKMQKRLQILFRMLKKEMDHSSFAVPDNLELAQYPEIKFYLPFTYKY